MKILFASSAAVLVAFGVVAAASDEASAHPYWRYGYAPYAYGPYSAGYDYYWPDSIDDAPADVYVAAPPYERGLRIVAAPGKRFTKFRWVRPYPD